MDDTGKDKTRNTPCPAFCKEPNPVVPQLAAICNQEKSLPQQQVYIIS